jgi:hypothetical protein
MSPLSALSALIVVLSVALGIRLYASGLYRTFRIFFIFIVFYSLHSGVLLVLDQTKNLYFKVWVLTAPVEWILQVMVVLELYSLVLRNHRGLYRVGRWALIVAVAIALLAAALSFIIPSEPLVRSRVLSYELMAERTIYLSLLVLILTLMFLLMRYPIRLSRNIAVHYVVFVMFFLGNAFVGLFLTTGGDVSPAIQYVVLLVAAIALGTWLVLLSPAGEQRRLRLSSTSYHKGREDELARLNDILLKLSARWNSEK